jgi:hypothetical protein
MLLLSLFVLFGFLSFIDERMLFGVSVWNKPMKFAISIAVFFWTMAWYMDYLPQQDKVERISVWFVGLMAVEMLIIVGQSLRGVPSHFNRGNWYDDLLFGIMGLAILINTYWVFRVWLYFRKEQRLPQAYRLAIRLGMLIFIISSLEGYVMAARLSHTIGAADGQEGLLFFGWAWDFGDLRVAHFIGLHALQVIPLFAWYMARQRPLWVWVFGFAYAGLVVLSFLQAMQGMGFWPF